MKLEVDKPEVKKLVVVYSGRFQPFHAGHYVSYLKLCQKFGKDNVYIATSNVTSGPKSPFNFNEKKEIATKMFNVPSDKFIEVKNPYAPKEILQHFDGKTTAYIAAVGEKDESRLTGKYFKPYKGKTGYGYDEIGYTYAVPAESNPISGTDVRSWLGSGDDESKKKGFLKAYPKFNADIFKMITNKLNEDGFPGGIGTGLDLPGGYINGAPTGSTNESNNTHPSSEFRKEPHPTRHETEHPSDEPDWYKTENLYDPIGNVIDRVVAEEIFKEFSKQYFGEAPNPIMDKEFDYTAADGKKKKITVKGALRLPKEHPAHVQASKLVGSDKTSAIAKGPEDAPANEPKKLPQQGKAAKQAAKPAQTGQPVKQGQTQQGKANSATGKYTTSTSQGAEQTPPPQTLSGAELKSSAEKKKDTNKSVFGKWGDKFKQEVKEIGDTIKTFLDEDEAHIAHEGHDPNSPIRKQITEKLTDFVAKMPANIAKHVLKVAKQKVHQLKNTGRGIQSLAVSAMKGEKPKFGMFKDRDGKWKHSENEAKRQKKAFIDTGKDIALTAAAVVTAGAISGAVAGAAHGIGGIAHGAAHGATHTLSHGVSGFLHHMAVDFGKHCFKESVFLATGAGHTQAANLAMGAGLIGENIWKNTINEEDDIKQNASMYTELLKQTLEKMETFEPNPTQYLEMLKSYAASKQKADLQKLVGPMNEVISSLKRENVNHFVEYATKRLKLKEQPKVTLIEDPEFSRQNHSLGGYNVDSKEIFVATEGRLTADILRTIAHEMVHRKQDEMGLIGDSVKDGADGSPIENKANSVAAILLREYGKLNKTIYNENINETIKKVGDKYVVYPKNGGDRLGTHNSLASAKKQLAAIEINKEDINIDVDKGDTVLMGKFKNKKTTVKNFGTDDHGMPTINGKVATTFRIPRGEEKSNPQSVFNEVGTNDWRYKAIMKMWDDATLFGKKKIGAVVCKDPNADRKKIERELRTFGYRDITGVGDELGLDEVTTNDWHFKAIMTLYDKSNSFGKKKIAAAVCSDPNASRKDIVVQLRDTDYEEVTAITDKLRLSEYIQKKKLSEKLSQSNLDSVERYADRELDPADIEFSNHFFDRVNDVRNGKEISEPELTGFFKRLGRHKKQFIDFLEKYNQIVVKDDRSNINIPFVKMANKVIAKTVMRKGDFQTTSPTIVNEVGEGSSKPYSFTQKRNEKNNKIYSFTTTSNEDYRVEFDYKDKFDAWEVSFATYFDSDDAVINKGELYSVMATITNISLDFIKKVNPKTVYFSSSKNFDNDNRREKLYLAYIKKQLPNWKLGKNSGFTTLTNPKYNNQPKFDWLKQPINEITQGLYAGNLKIGGKSVEVEVELLGADNKTKEFLTKIIHIDKEYQNKLPIGSQFKIPARVFRMPGGGWHKIKSSAFKESLNEGGAYGHMSHPFDDMNLTFGDLKNIITNALTGNLELTREKTDGQALAISWKNGRLIAARNKSHLQNAGAGAMGIEDVASKFAGRGGLTDAYNFAMKDLSAAIQSLSEPQRKKIFDEGKCFMNLEVIWPTSVNVIPYGQPLLVFHNTTCYDEKGVAIGAN
jgi:hypothetical protein